MRPVLLLKILRDVYYIIRMELKKQISVFCVWKGRALKNVLTGSLICFFFILIVSIENMKGSI